MGAGGDCHDPPADVLEQQVGEREVAEVVGAELQLEALRGASERRRHHAGVVDQQVELPVPRGGELAHRLEARQIELAYVGLAGHARCGRPALVEVAHG
jgi:hypothetical protein